MIEIPSGIQRDGTPKAITFDLDDTLYANHTSCENCATRVYSQHYPQAQHTNRAYWQSYSRQLTKARPERHVPARRLTLAQGFQGCGYTGDRLDAAVRSIPTTLVIFMLDHSLNITFAL